MLAGERLPPNLQELLGDDVDFEEEGLQEVFSLSPEAQAELRKALDAANASP